MSQAAFIHSTAANDAAGLPLAVSLFVDRAALRGTMEEDLAAAGLRLAEAGDLARLVEGDARPLGDVVVVDCPLAGPEVLAALARLDMRAARTGTRLVVSTSVEALDGVFGCLDQSETQILVDPSRAERVIALGRALALCPAGRVREMAEADRLALLRLTQQVGELAQRLERLSGTEDAGVRSPVLDFAAASAPAERLLVRTAAPELPNPRLVRRIIRQRQLRARFFDAELFADPAWDILLDLTAAKAERARVSVSSLCIAASVPPTTALRWIAQMTEAGLLRRAEDECDRRRAFISLTDAAAQAMSRYFAMIADEAGVPV